MNSRFFSFFAKVFSRLNICFSESKCAKVFYKIWDKIKNAFCGSFFARFFSDTCKYKDVWNESIFGKILNTPKKVLLWLQKKLSHFVNSQFEGSVLFGALSSWNNVPVRIYGIFFAVFSFSTLLIRNNGKISVLILSVITFVSLIAVLINRSINELASGSAIVRVVGELFTKIDEKENKRIVNTTSHFIVSGIMGVILSLLCTFFGYKGVFLVLAGILSFLFLFKYLLLGVFLTVAFSPVLPTMALVGLSFVCLFIFLVHAISNNEFTFKKSSFNVVVVFFVISLVWGCINSFDFMSSVKQVMVHFSFIIFYFILTNVIRTKKQWLALIKVFMLSAFLVGLYGIAQNFLGVSSTESWIDEEMFSDIKLRVYSFFNNPNVLGEFLVLTIPVALALMWNKVKEGHKVIYAVLLLSLMMCMIFTWSRGAWLGMLISTALFLAISDKRWIFVGVLAIFLIPVLLHFSGNTAIIERFLSIGNTADTSTAYRVSIWRSAIDIIKDFWVCGIGIGSDAFTTVYPSYSLAGAKFALHSHNLYLQFWVETGIIGIVSLISVLLGFLKTVFSLPVIKNIKNNDISKILVALGTGIVGFMFQGLTDYVWYNYKILMIFWIIIALGVSGASILKDELKEGESSV